MEYRHTQFGAVIIVAVGIVILAILVHSLIGGLIHPIEAGVAILLLIMVFLFASLTVEINHGNVTCYFGPGLIRKEIKLSDITEVRSVTNSWLAGWGIRWIPGKYMLWNVSGLQAVELTLKNGKKFRIGTDEPELLARAIQSNKITSA
ncbi:MAG: hypothetical protein HZB59_10270 [Ignavibacteriales bacterium]|nr:hypothetical protein [Ignavibacteriales bacterium]